LQALIKQELRFKIIGYQYPEKCSRCDKLREKRRSWLAFFSSVTDWQQIQSVDEWMLTKLLHDRPELIDWVEAAIATPSGKSKQNKCKTVDAEVYRRQVRNIVHSHYGGSFTFQLDEVRTRAINMRVAQYFLDAAGFHGMAETLSNTQKIEATYPGKVTRVAAGERSDLEAVRQHARDLCERRPTRRAGVGERDSADLQERHADHDGDPERSGSGFLQREGRQDRSMVSRRA
jgi:hypothetical protein